MTPDLTYKVYGRDFIGCSFKNGDPGFNFQRTLDKNRPKMSSDFSSHIYMVKIVKNLQPFYDGCFGINSPLIVRLKNKHINARFIVKISNFNNESRHRFNGFPNSPG
jgi:hypothetical protein